MCAESRARANAILLIVAFGVSLTRGAVAQVDAGACAGIDWIGECEGTTIRYCLRDQLIEIDCTDPIEGYGPGGTCGLLDCTDEAAGCQGYYCVAGAGEPCDPEEWWCDVEQGHGCLNGRCDLSESCDPDSFDVECDGDFILYCPVPLVWSFDCGQERAAPYTCGVDSNGEIDCLGLVGARCDPAVGDECVPALECVDSVCGLFDAAIPDMARPDTARPDTAQPDTAQPDVGGSDARRPDTRSPDLTRPDTTSPDRARPDQFERDRATSDTASPDRTRPDVAVPDTVAPDAGAPSDRTASHDRTGADRTFHPDAAGARDGALVDSSVSMSDRIFDEFLYSSTDWGLSQPAESHDYIMSGGCQCGAGPGAAVVVPVGLLVLARWRRRIPSRRGVPRKAGSR